MLSSWVCVNDGFPLVGVPGAQVYFTDHDETTPLRPDGSRAISCKPIDELGVVRKVVSAARTLGRLGELVIELF